jgi:hypothetical protein
MVELFKTNVEEKAAADAILGALRQRFPSCRFNFDLQDCDRLLRVECRQHPVHVEEIFSFLLDLGVKAEVLEDIVVVIDEAGAR